MKKFQSFSHRLTRSVILTVLAVMITISVFVFLIAAASILVYTKGHYSDIMDKARGNMAMIMNAVEVSADNIIDEISQHLESPEAVASTLQNELRINHHLHGCGVGFVQDYYPGRGHWYEPYALNTGDGTVIKDIGSESHDYFDYEWYQEGLVSQGGTWSNPYLDEEGAETALCTYSRRITDGDGKTVGVLGADISLDELSALIVNNVQKDNENSPFITEEYGKEQMIYCFIIGPNGDYIVHRDNKRILRTNFYDYAIGKDAERYKALGDAMRAGGEGEMNVTVDGIKSSVYYAPLLQSGWSMGIVVPMERLLKPGILFGGLVIFLILLGLLIVFFICRYTIRRSTKPLVQLADSAREVALGHFNTDLPIIRQNDEIFLLRDSFDNMQKSLEEYVRELTEATAQKAYMESELEVARSIQMSMLPMKWPAFPERKDLDIYGRLTPAKAVGGDLYDFHISDGKLFFCIGDVSGKGVPAALVMSVVGCMFRTLTESFDSPEKIVSSINATMSSRNENMMFVTLFVGILDLSTRVLQYTNGGHNAPVVISEGKASMLEVDSNVPVGIMADWTFSRQEVTLPPGSTLFLYTDGLTEATRSDGQLFGDGRVLELLSSLDREMPVQEIIARMTRSVEAFAGDAEQSDDLTMLAVRLS